MSVFINCRKWIGAADTINEDGSIALMTKFGYINVINFIIVEVRSYIQSEAKLSRSILI
ncbi:hypothetical protein [uncultured Clostridium sp.]|uniref:hypothetical protein n=1 Tax=uncultured Clostridium sp. TaxID=59620 RepID=UPI0028E73A1F|nr:hypothetical protein [uncultured Clostridium sp.]